MPCALSDDLICFTVEAPAEIATVGNGNPLSLEPFQADYRTPLAVKISQLVWDYRNIRWALSV